MAIKETEVWVKYSARTVTYYKSKGYEFPTHLNKTTNRLYIKEGTEILVKVEDLTDGSHVRLTKICDICGLHVPQTYTNILRHRRNNKTDGLDRCYMCTSSFWGKQSGIANDSNCIATTNPELVELFWNKEDTLIRSFRSDQRADFKCPNCGNKVKNRVIKNILKRKKVPCACNDNYSYPEKFMYSVLTQLNIEFDFQKVFEWSKNVKTENPLLNGLKKYDFYLNKRNIIIETHGGQHDGLSFESLGGKSPELEQENDRVKKIIAEENGIINYISINCTFSDLEFIKMNTLKSPLNDLFDLSKIDWLKCHEFALSSLVKKACDLWNEGLRDARKIGELLKINRNTAARYLKKGKLIGLCDYDAKDVRKDVGLRLSKHKEKKTVIRLSLEGKFIDEWESATKASRELGISNMCISNVCSGKQKTGGGFRWMFKKDYSPTKAINLPKYDENRQKKKIVQLSQIGEFIREWENMISAEKELGIFASSISNVCRGKQKTAGGFRWMFKNDYEKLVEKDL